MDLKNLLCNNRPSLFPQEQPICPASPIDTWLDSCQSTPSLSSCSSTFSSPSTLYLSADTSSPPQQQTQTRTPWTASEDFLLQKGYSQGLSWAMISSTYLPHRSRGCCWGRFKTLQAKMSEHREWSSSEDHLLLLAIKKQDRLFKQAWKAVARELGDRSWRECDVRSSKLNRAVRKQQHQRKHSLL